MKINLDQYSDIILDFGGVILNIDYMESVRSFEKLGFNSFDAWFSQAKQHELFDALEVGKINATDFYNEVRNISGLHLSDLEIENAWNALLLDLPMDTMRVIESLNKTHRLYLLSNTNAIHANSFIKSIDETYGWNKFTALFKQVYLSHEIGLRKPHGEIFEFVIQSNNLKKENTLFIDDSIQHVEGAKLVGLKAHHLNLKSDESLKKLF